MPLGKLAHSYRHSHALHTRLTEAYHHLQARLQSAPLGKLQACRLDHHRAAAGLRNDAGRSAARLVRSPVRRTLAEAMRHQRRRCATLRHAAPLRIPSFRDRGRLLARTSSPVFILPLSAAFLGRWIDRGSPSRSHSPPPRSSATLRFTHRRHGTGASGGLRTQSRRAFGADAHAAPAPHTRRPPA
jgi:hypothetical protein